MRRDALQRGFTDREIREDSSNFNRESAATVDKDVDLPPERYELLAAIEYLANLGDDWNGYNAQKPSELSTVSAKCFIERLFLNRYYPDKVSPNGEGGLVFTWNLPKERILLTIEGARMHLSHEKEGQQDEFVNEIPFNCEEIPSEVISHLPIKKSR